MSNPDLREAVHLAIRRHLAARPTSPSPRPPSSIGTAPSPAHPSHARFALADGAASGGRCVIEPAVDCVHCGHCQTQGY